MVLPLPDTVKDHHHMKNSFLTLIQNEPATDFEYTAMIQEHLPGHIKELYG